MPFKDINYKKLNQSRELEKQLKSEIAVVNKLMNPNLKPDEKIATIELITPLRGKHHRKSDPVKQLFQEEKAVRDFAPLVNALQIVDSSKSVERPAMTNLPQSVFSDEDIEYYRRQKLPSLVEVREDQAVIQEALRKLTSLNKDLGRQRGVITRRLKKHPATEFDLERYDTIVNERGRLDKYKKELVGVGKNVGRGVELGQYTIPLKRLKRDNIVSVRYKKNRKKIVPAFGATRVSDNVKKTILGKAPNESLSHGEKHFLDKLYMNAGQQLSTSHARAIRGSGIFTSVQEIVERIKVLMGEMEAGNTSISLKNELSDLLHYLYKHKQIKKGVYTKLVSSLV